VHPTAASGTKFSEEIRGALKMEEKTSVILNQKQYLELEEIIIDNGKEAALEFLKEYIYKPIKKQKEDHGRPQV
jgi:hypothetical protein